MRLLSLFILILFSVACGEPAVTDTEVPTGSLKVDPDAIVRAADEFLDSDIVTVTNFIAERSAGGLHDYYSEGRYWWPDENNPNGPYIRRDGIANPQNFSGHKSALRDLSEMVTTLTAAYEITGEEKYARRAIEHVTAWFANPDTHMNPSLLYGQAIKGISTGRGIGIIDTLRLINVALSIELLEKSGLLKGSDLTAIKGWFGDYGNWLTTHPYGDDEKNNNNNHSTWWGAQVAAFARVADRPDLMKVAEEQFRNQLPIQVATDGSLPDELGRTKPFHYVNYTLRAWATYAELLSTENKNYWDHTFTTNLTPYTKEQGEETAPDEPVATGKTVSLKDAMTYALPYFKEPSNWPYLTELEKDIHPHANDFMVFASWGLGDNAYLQLWRELEAEEKELHANLVLWQKINADE